MSIKTICAGIGAVALIGCLAACGSATSSGNCTDGICIGGPVYNSAYSAGSSFAAHTIAPLDNPGTSGGGYSVSQASEECSQAYINDSTPGDGISPPAQYTPGTDSYGDWTQGWSDGCANQLVNG